MNQVRRSLFMALIVSIFCNEARQRRWNCAPPELFINATRFCPLRKPPLYHKVLRGTCEIHRERHNGEEDRQLSGDCQREGDHRWSSRRREISGRVLEVTSTVLITISN